MIQKIIMSGKQVGKISKYLDSVSILYLLLMWGGCVWHLFPVWILWFAIIPQLVWLVYRIFRFIVISYNYKLDK